MMAPEKLGSLQMALLLLMGVNYCMVSMNHALPTFHGYTPSFYCPVVNKTDACVASSNSTNDGGSSCPGGYIFHIHERAFVKEWQLVCDRRVLLPLTATLYFCGVTLGAIFCGMLADYYGRRPVMLVCVFGQALLGVGIYFSNTFILFIILRVIQGFFLQGLQGATFTLLVELFPPRIRTAVGVVLEVYWALGLASLAACAYFVPDWRHLQLTLAVPAILPLLYICVIPESPHWLLTQGRHEEAEATWRKLVSNCKTNTEGNKHTELITDITENVETSKSKEEALPMKCSSMPRIEQLPEKTMEKLEQNMQYSSHEDDISISAMSTDSLAHEHESKIIEESTTGICKDDSISEQVGTNVLDQLCDKKKKKISSDIKPPHRDEKSENVKQKKQNGRFLELLQRRVIRKHTYVMTYIWFSVSLSYYGIMFYLPALSGERHFNFFLGSVLELAAYIAGYWVLGRYGRRVPLCIFMVASGTICAVVGGISVVHDGSSSWNATTRTVLTLMGKTTIVSAFLTIFLYTSELFPTVLRAAALGLCGFWGRIGSLISPQLLLVGEYTSSAVPMVCMGILCLAAGLTTIVLPETEGKSLPDTIEEAQNLSQKKFKYRK